MIIRFVEFYYLHLALFFPAVFFYNTPRTDLQPFFFFCVTERSQYMVVVLFVALKIKC